MDFPERLKFLREEKGLTQLELGQIFKISRSSVSKYEAGERRPDPGSLKAFSEYFNVSVDFLLGITDSRDSSEKVIDNALQDDPELLEFWLEMKKREDLQLLFKQVKPMTPEGVKKVIRVIKAMEEEIQEG